MHNLPQKTSWIKTKAFAWSTKQRYSATFLALFILIFITWFATFRPLHIRQKRALLLDQECQSLEYQIHTLEEDKIRLKNAVPLSKPHSLSVYTLLAHITHMLEATGITLESYSTYQRKKKSSPIFKLTTTGTFEAFLHFLALLKEETTTLHLKNIKLTRLYHMRLKAHIELSSL